MCAWSPHAKLEIFDCTLLFRATIFTISSLGPVLLRGEAQQLPLSYFARSSFLPGAISYNGKTSGSARCHLPHQNTL